VFVQNNGIDINHALQFEDETKGWASFSPFLLGHELPSTEDEKLVHDNGLIGCWLV